MIIDFHTHIFCPEIRKNREKFFPSEPAFAQLYSSPKSRLAGANELINSMDEHGVAKAVVFGFPWQNSNLFKKHNDYIMAAVDRYPERLIGFGCFDLFNSQAYHEAERCLRHGLSGIGEIAFYHSGIDETLLDQLEPILDTCLQNDVPVLVHTNEPIGHAYPGKTPITLAQIYGLVKKFPRNKIVLAHWGGGIFFYLVMKKEVKDRLKNVYFDTAASPFLYEPIIYRLAIQTAGVDKILFGSDFPLLQPSRYFQEFSKAGLTKTETAIVQGTNAANLLKL
ncbi:MAG: amidohydrolase family protein [Deltaproteobacteria bacterium]|nr:MAG: amidohydrolase family protein [Deltaproteobacteria bacterium]